MATAIQTETETPNTSTVFNISEINLRRDQNKDQKRSLKIFWNAKPKLKFIIE